MSGVRGDAWEHDPGPPGASGWAELFAETPNYRGLGRAVAGREAFRWHHGPMFFRGRLDGSAKVLVVGQEGAQDESLSHRSFTGGTGARMQHLLRFIGFDRSYLFLNSFVYPIFGQYTPDLRPLAQDARSPIAAHRNRILDKAALDGDIRLVIAVGVAAKESATGPASKGTSAGTWSSTSPRSPASNRRCSRGPRPRCSTSSSAPRTSPPSPCRGGSTRSPPRATRSSSKCSPTWRTCPRPCGRSCRAGTAKRHARRSTASA
ncbi:MAG TPA: uracil-DNA glycosylase family protein [Pseudonocardiaceae bacterium]|nr:uracil-DNA glycosylase family protein [Pseudonocardiaceae bacterium]